jgi:hypothetical protein
MQLNFEKNELDYILNVLAQRPYNEVTPLIQKIQAQLQGQLAPVSTPEQDEVVGE